MTLKGYYLETLYHRFNIYRIIIINMLNEVSTYTVAINISQDIKTFYPDYVDLGGII